MAPAKQSTAKTLVVRKVTAAPCKYDVLCGQNKNNQNHHGNQLFRRMVEEMTPQYQRATSKSEKMKFTREVVLAMQQTYGSRFIKKHKGEDGVFWKEISEQLARDKVSHAIRFAAKNKRQVPRMKKPIMETKDITANEVNTCHAPSQFNSSHQWYTPVAPSVCARDAMFQQRCEALRSFEQTDMAPSSAFSAMVEEQMTPFDPERSWSNLPETGPVQCYTRSDGNLLNMRFSDSMEDLLEDPMTSDQLLSKSFSHLDVLGSCDDFGSFLDVPTVLW